MISKTRLGLGVHNIFRHTHMGWRCPMPGGYGGYGGYGSWHDSSQLENPLSVNGFPMKTSINLCVYIYVYVCILYIIYIMVGG